MQIEPNGLMAGNPLTPLQSGHPFFRGNVMPGNGIDGLMVTTNRSLPVQPRTTTRTSAREEAIGPGGYFNLSVNSVWDRPT